MANLNLEIRAAGAPPAGAGNVAAAADPTDGGMLVHIAGGGGGSSGHVIVDSGNVGVTSLPALAAGTNVIGHVIVDSEPTADALLTSIVGALGSYLATLAGTTGATGAAAPSTAVEVAGKDGAGYLRPIRTDTEGVAYVLDRPLVFVAGGVTSCVTSTKIATGQGGGGYLTVTNLDTAAIYVGLGGVTSSTGMPILPGASDTAYYADVATIYATGSAAVGWGVRR